MEPYIYGIIGKYKINIPKTFKKCVQIQRIEKNLNFDWRGLATWSSIVVNTQKEKWIYNHSNQAFLLFNN